MQADLMAFPLHALKEQLIALYILPDDKEGGVHPPLGQAVQKHRGGGGLWPVVKGEGYIGPRRDFRPAQRLPFPALLRLGAIGDSRQGQRRQGQPPLMWSVCAAGLFLFGKNEDSRPVQVGIL